MKFFLESILAIAGVIALAIALWGHFNSSSPAPIPGEGKRVVAFRQLVNRICTEHRENLQQALREARSRVERLGYVARAMGWDLNDLESITPPPTRFDAFLSDVAVRRRVRSEVLALQRAVELGNQGREVGAITSLEELEADSRELAREAGLVRCMRVLPPIPKLIRG